MAEILFKELSYAVVGAAMEVHGQLVGQYEADILVEQSIILELKAVSAISAAHVAQAHHYLAATGLRLAIIMNFGAMSLETKRIAK